MGNSMLAPVAVSGLISALAYGSQFLFLYIDPGPLNRSEYVTFNVLVGCIWICYLRTCLTQPGHVPPGWSGGVHGSFMESDGADAPPTPRWCKKCERQKPPRAHHCKSCQSCIPKMDHHCIWTSNCVSHRTFPHFMRFLFYAVSSMSYLGYLVFLRAQVLWGKRNLPSYLGPSMPQLAFLFILMIANFLTCFAVGVMFLRSLWSLWMNITSIESWEIERHEALVRRARRSGGYVDGPNGIRMRIVKQEFPYDIGIWSNLTQGMGQNPLAWLWPLAQTPRNEDGLHFDVNGFEDPSTTWPPPDPDKMPRRIRSIDGEDSLVQRLDSQADSERLDEFRKRQEADMRRRRHVHAPMPHVQTPQESEDEASETNVEDDSGLVTAPQGTWRATDGESLGDLGVDEQVDLEDDDDVPLGVLLRKNR